MSVPKNVIKCFSCRDRKNILPNNRKALGLFVTILVTSCTYEKTSSKLNIVG